MSDQHGSLTPSLKSGMSEKSTKKTSKSLAASKTAEMLEGAAETARRAASDTVAGFTDQFRETVDRQVVSGADIVGQLATSTKRTAEDLEGSSPFVAGIVRSLADRMDGYADTLRGQSVEELAQGVSDLTRRQPALVFGLAAFAGFLTYRTFASARSANQAGQGQRGENHSYGA